MESARLALVEDGRAVEAIARRQRDGIVAQRGAPLFLRREGSASAFSARLERALSGAETVLAVVGCYDGVVFGYGLVEFEELAGGSTLARLTDLVVDGEIRGSGIGEAMMNLVVSLAEDRGCTGIDVHALPGDRQTKNFFESFGLKARLLTLHRALDHPAEASAR